MKETITDTSKQYVTFWLGGELFGTGILAVQEIIRRAEITRVPNANGNVVGVTNLRGKVIPIIDLNLVLGFPAFTTTKDTRTIIVELEDKVIGFIVDSVSEVVNISPDEILPPPDNFKVVSSNYIIGIHNRTSDIVTILNLEKLLK